MIIDIDLGSGQDKNGVELQKTIRDSGKIHPIIMVTGLDEQLNRPIRYYKNVFASGPTFFFEKGSGDFLKIFEQASKNIDPVRRSLYLFKKRYDNQKLTFGEDSFSIDELLLDSEKTSQFIHILRDSFYEFFIELWKNEDL